MNPTPDIPHISFPFRFNPDTSVPCTEQDTEEEIWDCVNVTIRCPIGYRLQDPEFGVPQFEFEEQPVDASFIEEIVLDCEPRATVLVAEEHDKLQELVDHVFISPDNDNG